jgi:hypothetical protein
MSTQWPGRSRRGLGREAPSRTQDRDRGAGRLALSAVLGHLGHGSGVASSWWIVSSTGDARKLDQILIPVIGVLMQRI